MASPHFEIRPDQSTSPDAWRRVVNRRPEAERGDRTNTRHGHEPADLRIMTCQLQNLTIEIVDLLFDSLACPDQRSDHSDQVWSILDQLPGSCRKDVELGTADDETKVLEEAANMVLKIPLDLDQQCSARQQGPDSVTIEILDANFLEPTSVHDAGDAGRIIAVTFIDLHLEYRLSMARVDTDHW